jgi:NAD(P)-dependent dehydrogenase (short-subunit alcohol dehydrogenase family)
LKVVQNPFQRVTTAEDLAKMVGKLADEDFHWINGTVNTVDGGESIYKYFELLDEN